MKQSMFTTVFPLAAQLISISFAQMTTVYPTSTIAPINLIKRNSDIATVTLGPVADYLKTPADPTSATGNEFLMVPMPTPAGGFHIYFGPDLYKSLQAAASDNCMKGPDSKCESMIASLLSVAQVDLQRKKIPEIKIDGLLIVAIIVGLMRTPKRSLLHGGVWTLEVFDPEYASMSARPSSTIVVLSEAGDRNPFTISSTSRPKPTAIHEENGDVILKFHPDHVHMINDLMSMIQRCKPKRKRSNDIPDMNCFVGASDFLLTNTLGGPAGDLAVAVEGIPHPGGDGPDAMDMLLALATFLLHARDIFFRVLGQALSYEVPATEIELMVFWVVFIVGTGTALGVENKIPAKNINPRCKPVIPKCPDKECKGKDRLCTVGEQKGCTCKAPGCLPEDRTPSCKNCGGNNGSNKCLGLKEFENLWQGCECIREGEPEIHLVDWSIWNQLLEVFMSIKDKPRPEKADRLECEKFVRMDPKLFDALIPVWCEDNPDLSKTHEKIYGAADVGGGDWSKHKNLSLDFTWKTVSKSDCKKDCGCYDQCESIFRSFLVDSCAAANKEEMAERGEFRHDCGVASYFLSSPEPEPEPVKPPFAVGTCRVELNLYLNSFDGRDQPLRTDANNKWGSTYSVTVAIFDADSKLIGEHPTRTAAGSVGADRKEKMPPLEVPSKLEHKLVVTPEKRGEYVQFWLPEIAWPSNNIKGDPRADCNADEGKKWKISTDGTEKYRFIKCTFECKWAGGRSSNA